MTGWGSVAVAFALSLISSFIFLLARFRGVGKPFGRRSWRWASAVIVFIALISAVLGVLLAQVKITAIFVSLLLPSLLWLPKAGQRFENRPFASFVTLGFSWLLDQLEEAMAEDTEVWCDERLRAVTGAPQLISDAANYYYDWVGRRIDTNSQAYLEFRFWRDSIVHKIQMVRLVDLSVSPAQLAAVLQSDPETPYGRYDVEDPIRMALRLRSDAENELSLFLAALYRLRYYNLPIYPFRPSQPGAGRIQTAVSDGVLSLKQARDPILAETDAFIESVTDTEVFRDTPTSDGIDDHTLAGVHRPESQPSKHLLPDRIIREMAHSMKTPLAHLEAAIELLREGASAESETENTLREMNASVNACKATLVAYRERTGAPARVKRRTAESLVRTLQDMHKVYARHSGKKTRLELEIPDSVTGYSNDYILTILLPLLENAVEASPDTVVTVTSEDFSEGIQFVVKNDVERQIDVTNLGNPGKSSKPGHEGLGIPTVKDLVLEHGGSATYDIVHNEFVFRIRLPRG